MSLEVDRRDDLPIPQESQKEPFRYDETGKEARDYAYSNGDNGPSRFVPGQQKHSRQKSTVLFLSVALALMTILAALAAGIGGSLAAKRGNDNTNLHKSLDNLTAQLHNCSVTAQSQQAQPFNSSDNTTTSHTSFAPTSNCTSMKDTYTSARTGAIFNVHCDTDYPNSDMLGVYVFTFADCMEACSSWNSHNTAQDSQQCHAVAYDTGPRAYPEYSGAGNCWLKNSGNITAIGKQGADAAVLATDS